MKFNLRTRAMSEFLGTAFLVSSVVGSGITTFGLLSVIWGCSRFRASVVPFAVGSYFIAAYWFTASTSFANPAVTIQIPS
jgi:glycerol uptake facilitator-like aquaporin